MDKKQYYVVDECNITLNQIEMLLCEFFKYWKITACNICLIVKHLYQKQKN